MGRFGTNFGKNAKVTEQGDRPKDPETGGTMEHQRWQRAWTAAKNGVWDEIPGDIKLRQYGTIKRIMFDHQALPESQEKLDFHWWWGASGSGKSRSAREQNPGAYLKCINKWGDNYEGEDCVLHSMS